MESIMLIIDLTNILKILLFHKKSLMTRLEVYDAIFPVACIVSCCMHCFLLHALGMNKGVYKR